MNRFKTVGKESNLLGRLALDFSMDIASKSLIVHLNSARDLRDRFAGPDGSMPNPDFSSFVRVQVHKKKESERVVSSLFSTSNTTSAPTRNTWRSTLHNATLFPVFDEVRCYAVRSLTRYRAPYSIYLRAGTI
jgi:hypothetical protein